ncbi:hypothetical protein HDV00_010389, partial [Rhizophlyctis rosea]
MTAGSSDGERLRNKISLPTLRRPSNESIRSKANGPGHSLERRSSTRVMGFLFKSSKQTQASTPIPEAENECDDDDSKGDSDDDSRSIRSVRSLRSLKSFMSVDGGIMKAMKGKRGGKGEGRNGKGDDPFPSLSSITLVNGSGDANDGQARTTQLSRSSSSPSPRSQPTPALALPPLYNIANPILPEINTVGNDWAWETSEDERKAAGRRRSKTAGSVLEQSKTWLQNDGNSASPPAVTDNNPKPPPRSSSMSIPSILEEMRNNGFSTMIDMDGPGVMTSTPNLSPPPRGESMPQLFTSSERPDESTHLLVDISDPPPRRKSSKRHSKRMSGALVADGVPEAGDGVSVLHKQVAIETEDPSHLFWVPAHLHPELHPTDFRKWLAKHADGPDAEAVETSAGAEGVAGEAVVVPGVTGTAGKPLRRTKSFIERHVSITPENLDEFVEAVGNGVIPNGVAAAGRSRSTSMTASMVQTQSSAGEEGAGEGGAAVDGEGDASGATAAGGKGLPPLKRSRHIKPRRSTLERQMEQEGLIPVTEENGVDGPAAPESPISSVEVAEPENKTPKGLAPRAKKGKKIKPVVLGLPKEDVEQFIADGGDAASVSDATVTSEPVAEMEVPNATGPYCPYPPIVEYSSDDSSSVNGDYNTRLAIDLPSTTPPPDHTSTTTDTKSKKNSTRSSSESVRSTKEKDPKEKDGKKWG